MKTIPATFTAFLTVFALSMFFTSCKTETKPSEPEIILQSTEISVPAEGGDFTILLTVLNPVNDGTISAAPSTEWITVTYESTDSVCYSVAPNESEQSRTGTLGIRYSGISEPSVFTVSQSPTVKPSKQSIEISLKDIGETYFIADITPSDNGMCYMITRVSMDFITEGGYEDDQALFEYEMSYYSMIAQVTGKPLAEVLKKYGYTGPQTDMEFSNLAPGSENLLYAYGVDLENIELMTEIARCPVTTTSPDYINVDFEIQAEISGAVVDLSVSPVDYDGYYYIDILSNVTSEDEITDYCFTLWNTIRSTMTNDGYSTEEILEQFCCKGNASKRFEMNPNTEYYAVAFAVNENALFYSYPEHLKLTTSDVLPSDNSITIQFSDITRSSVHLSSVTTNDDTYAFILLESERLEGMTDEEILTYLTSGTYNLFKTNGDYEETVTGLEPDTEYTAAAFGYVSNTVTTQLFKKSFRTLE